jgi:hypothetical protein
MVAFGVQAHLDCYTDPSRLIPGHAISIAKHGPASICVLQALTGATLLAPQQSLDVVLDPEWDHAGAAGFSKLQVGAWQWMMSNGTLAAAAAAAAHVGPTVILHVVLH